MLFSEVTPAQTGTQSKASFITEGRPLSQTFLDHHRVPEVTNPPWKSPDWLLWLQVTESPLQWYMDWNCNAVLVQLTERGWMSKLWSNDKLQWLAGWHDHLFKLWSFHHLLRFVEPWWWSGRRYISPALIVARVMKITVIITTITMLSSSSHVCTQPGVLRSYQASWEGTWNEKRPPNCVVLCLYRSWFYFILKKKKKKI